MICEDGIFFPREDGRKGWQKCCSRAQRILPLLVLVREMMHNLLLNGLDTIPATTQPLLPQADPIVTRADSENVATQAPADTPCDSIDVEDSGFPFPFKVLIEFCHNKQRYVRRSEDVQMRTFLSCEAEAM